MGFYWVLLGFTGFDSIPKCLIHKMASITTDFVIDRAVPGFNRVFTRFTGFYGLFVGFYWTSLGFSGFESIAKCFFFRKIVFKLPVFMSLPGFYWVYWVLSRFTVCSWGFTRFYWVLLGLTRFRNAFFFERSPERCLC